MGPKHYMQERTANIILGLDGPEDRFTLCYGPFRFMMRIKPLTARQVISISREVSKIPDINEEAEMFPELMNKASSLEPIARVIAIATGTKWKRLVARAIMKLPLKDIHTLFSVVRKQSDPTPFFFITILAKGRMNILKPER